jgi:endonuclease-3 related protein
VRARWRLIPGPPADPVKARLLRFHVALLRRFGRLPGPPGRSAYEMAVGLILGRRGPRPAARAVAALRARGLLVPGRLAGLTRPALAAILRRAGVPAGRALPLLAFTRWLVTRHGGRAGAMGAVPLAALRRELVALPGLGPEAADAILVHAAGKPVLVADASVRRVLVRHRLLAPGLGYEEARALLEAHLPSDPALLAAFHALLRAAASAGSVPPVRRPPGARPAGRPRPGWPGGARARPSP